MLRYFTKDAVFDLDGTVVEGIDAIWAALSRWSSEVTVRHLQTNVRVVGATVDSVEMISSVLVFAAPASTQTSTTRCSTSGRSSGGPTRDGA
jgi:hypothetical protein